MTDIKRAARYFYLISESFGTDCRSFGVSSKDIRKAVDYLKEVLDRLNKVVIENQDFERLIKTYDRPDSLFYLDPPYYEAEKYYPDRFNPEDHERLQKCLGNLKGRFVLSYNDCQQIRGLYDGYTFVEVDIMDNLVNKEDIKSLLSRTLNKDIPCGCPV